jgi:zinc D-Ala-D-Ala dipeptidase
MTTLIADPRIADIPVHDNDEPLVDLATRGIACSEISSGVVVSRLVRAGVAARLVAANASLPRGLRLFVVEGCRTALAQQEIASRYRRRLEALNPWADGSEIRRLASRYVAPLSVAPHVAGAAVDVTLIDADGLELDLGTPLDATPEDSDNACAFAAADISDAARDNRRALAAALGAAGLVNYPTEWWHWSYGDRYWAHSAGYGEACYDPVAGDRLLHSAANAGGRA